MADRRSTYVFSSEEYYEEAKEHLRKKMSSDTYDSDKLNFEGWYCGNYEISIMDECTDPEMAASICREHRGRYKSY